MQKFFMKEQSHSRVIRKYSQRSQNVMNTLTLDRMGLERKNLQFLPQIGRMPYMGMISRDRSKGSGKLK